jgi:hypothetical protein
MSPRTTQSFHLARSEVVSTNASGIEIDADEIDFLSTRDEAFEFYALRRVATELRASEGRHGRA